MYKALIADDEDIIRGGLAKLLAKDPDIQLVAQAEDGMTALELAQEHMPDLLLVDINMPFLNGLEFISKLGDLLSGAVIIIITGYDDFEYAQKALRLGVFDYMLKPIMEDTFYNAIGRAKEQLGHARRQVKYLEWARLQMDKNRPMLISNFVKNWLDGRYSQPEIEEQTGYLDIQVPQPHGITIAHISLSESYSPLSLEWDENLLLYAAENIAREIYEELQPLTFSSNSNGDLIIFSRCQPREEWDAAGTRLEKLLEEHLPVQVEQIRGTGEEQEQIPELYAELLLELNNRQKYTPVVVEAKRQVDQHYDWPELSLQWIAERQNISPQYLSRLFRHETGITFVDYVTQTRIRKAMEQLLDSDMKIYEIAELVGYSTQHYFSNAFKKVLGVSPAEYRKAKHL